MRAPVRRPATAASRARVLLGVLAALAALGAIASVGCDEAEPANAQGGSGGTSGGDTSAAAGAAGGDRAGQAGQSGEAGASGAAPGTCAEAPGEVDPQAPRSCVREVRGRVLEESGAAVGGLTITVCGAVCFGATSAADGSFVVPVGVELVEDAYALLVHGRPDHASTVLRLPASPPELVSFDEAIQLARFVPTGQTIPADGAAAQTLTAGSLTLEVPAETTWELDPEDVALDDARPAFLAVEVSGAAVPAFAHEAAYVFALGPFQARPSRPLGVRVANTRGLPAGSSVELVVMDDDLYFEPNTGGLPRVVGQGHVSADGATITSDPDRGLDVLTWLAIRPSP
jgi:hypothetical protein